MELLKGCQTKPGQFFATHQTEAVDFGIRPLGMMGTTNFYVKLTDNKFRAVSYDQNIRYSGHGTWELVQ
jgi:hypothetical protein